MDFPRPEILLQDPVPPPLHGMAPRTIMGSAWWDRERHAAAAKNNHKCWACNIPKDKARKHKWLEGHECYRTDWLKGTSTLVEVVSLCHYCHNYIHMGRLRCLLEAGDVSLGFVEDVIRHGDRLTAHLPVRMPIETMATWSDWVLIIDGTPYPSRFAHQAEWNAYYQWLGLVAKSDTAASLKYFREFVTESRRLQTGATWTP